MPFSVDGGKESGTRKECRSPPELTLQLWVGTPHQRGWTAHGPLVGSCNELIKMLILMLLLVFFIMFYHQQGPQWIALSKPSRAH